VHEANRPRGPGRVRHLPAPELDTDDTPWKAYLLASSCTVHGPMVTAFWKRTTSASMSATPSTKGSEGTPWGASVSSDRRAQDRSQAKPDEVVQTPVARLSSRAASRATNASAVRAAEIVLTHRAIWKFAD